MALKITSNGVTLVIRLGTFSEPFFSSFYSVRAIFNITIRILFCEHFLDFFLLQIHFKLYPDHTKTLCDFTEFTQWLLIYFLQHYHCRSISLMTSPDRSCLADLSLKISLVHLKQLQDMTICIHQ